MFDGFAYGNVYRLTNGQVWEQVGATISVRARVNPPIVIWESNGTYWMKLDEPDDDRTAMVRQAEILADSYISGQFDGLGAGNVYKLVNGQVWRQTDAWVWVWVAIGPHVLIFSSGGVPKMKVEGISHAVTVAPQGLREP